MCNSSIEKKRVTRGIAIGMVVLMLVGTIVPKNAPVMRVQAKTAMEKVLVIGANNRSLIAKSKNQTVYTYRSSNPRVASVSSNGVITGKKKGKANVVRYVTKNKRTKIDQIMTVKVEKLKISGKKTVYVSGKYQFKTNAAFVKWKVSDKKKATISKKGVLKAKKTGKITLTAKAGGLTVKKKITVKKELDEDITGKDVLIVEDIIDSGNTLHYLVEILYKRKPNSIKVCTLLDKPERRTADVKVDYSGFNIPDEFVVGYGLDYAQKYRNLPFIGVVEFTE